MKILVNNCFGGYCFTKEFMKKFNMDYYGPNSQETYENRMRQDVIEAVENDETGSFNSASAEIVVVEMPDDITDFCISDHEGMETLYYVVNGKIYSV